MFCNKISEEYFLQKYLLRSEKKSHHFLTDRSQKSL